MNPTRKHIWLTLALIAMLSLSCSMPNLLGNKVKELLGEVPAPGEVEQLVEELPTLVPVEDILEQVTTPETAQGMVEQAEEAVRELLTSISGNDTSMLDSYRTTFKLTTEGSDSSGNATTQTIEINEEINRTQDLYHNNLHTESTHAASPASDLDFYLQGDKTYLYNSGTPEFPCMMIGSGVDSSNEIKLLRPEDFFATIDLAERLESDVMVNGIKSDHYRVMNSGMQMGETLEQSGEIWIAQEGGYIVRYTGSAQGNFDIGDETDQNRVEWEYNLFDANQVAVVDFPVECRDQQETVEDVPIPDNAVNKEIIAGIITFESPDSPEQLGDFYRTELTNRGWSITEDSSMAALVMMSAEKEGQSLQIMITTGASSGSSIIITTIPLQ